LFFHENFNYIHWLWQIWNTYIFVLCLQTWCPRPFLFDFLWLSFGYFQWQEVLEESIGNALCTFGDILVKDLTLWNLNEAEFPSLGKLFIGKYLCRVIWGTSHLFCYMKLFFSFLMRYNNVLSVICRMFREPHCIPLTFIILQQKESSYIAMVKSP
jgi:hypothetical protein